MARPYKGWSVFWSSDKKCWILSRGGKQKLIPRTVKNKHEALKWAMAWLAQEGLFDPDGTAKRVEETELLGDMADRWVKWRESRIGKGWEPATVSNNRSHVRHSIKPAFAGKTITEVTPRVIAEAIRNMNGAPNTTRNVYRTLVAMFDDCIELGWYKLDTNPAKALVVKKAVPDAITKAQEVLADTRLSLEQCQLLVSDQRIPIERRVKYICALTMAARDGEVMGLAWGAIDFESLTVRIFQSAKIRRYTSDPSVGKPKTIKSRRAIPLHSQAALALREWLRVRSLELKKEPAAEHPVFPGREPKEFTRTHAAVLFRNDLRKVGIKDSVCGVPLQFHHLRHTALNLLREAGVEAGARDALAGHSPTGAGDAHYQHRGLRDDVEKIRLIWAGEAPGP